MATSLITDFDSPLNNIYDLYNTIALASRGGKDISGEKGFQIMAKRFLIVLLALSLLAMVGSVLAQEDEGLALTLLHTNDEHAAHAPNANGDGGVARVAAVVGQIRAEGGNILLLDAGDRFTGTLFHQQYRGADQVQIMNLLDYDAMALGNHEFDDGDDVLAAFIDGIDFPALSANLTVAEGSPLDGKVAPYTVLEVAGQSIGVIGLTTADTAFIASPGEGTEFSQDYAGVVNAAVAELEAQGINKIILITHIGYLEDVGLASSLTGVDVIIGGHSHTLMSNAYTAAAVNEYPAVAADSTGAPLLIVQAGGGNSLYLGRLEVEFDAAGVLTDWGGDTIFLSQYITPDPTMAALIDDLAAPIEELRQTVIGQTSVFLVGDRVACRAVECTLGNLITDALRDATGAQIAITNGGGIRASIPNADTPEDVILAAPLDVTLGDVLTVLPFGNLVSTFSISGADVIAALEHGLSALGTDAGTGRFPQVSGVRFTYDISQPVGSRIVSVEVEAEDGTFGPIDPEAIYTVASNDFMRNGGDGYTMFAENAINPYDFGAPLDQVLADYIRDNSPVNPVIEGRINRAQ